MESAGAAVALVFAQPAEAEVFTYLQLSQT